MIIKDQVMEMLLISSPSYKNRYDKYIKENYKPGEERLIYIEVCDFIHHLFDNYLKREVDEFDNIFELIERLHTDGDDPVKELATVGFLEDLQNILLRQNIDLIVFEVYLRPVSRTWWNNLIDFWNGKTGYLGGPLRE